MVGATPHYQVFILDFPKSGKQHSPTSIIQTLIIQPSIIRTLEPRESAGQSTNIGHDMDVQICNGVQGSHHLLFSYEKQRIAFK